MSAADRLPIVKPSRLASVLKKLGFRAVRQKGSHIFFQHPDGRTTLLTYHAGEDIGRGLLRRILREIEVTPEEFSKHL